MRPAEGLEAFRAVLGLGKAQVTVLPVDWQVLFRQVPVDGTPPLLAARRSRLAGNVTSGPAIDERADLIRRMAEATPGERRELIAVRLRSHAARILGLAGAELLDPTQLLGDLGLDSLMAVELKNRIEADFAVNLPVGAVLEGPSCLELAAMVAEQLADQQAAGGNDTADSANGSPLTGTSASERAPEAIEAERLLANLDQLADDEVDALLAMMETDQGVAR